MTNNEKKKNEEINQVKKAKRSLREDLDGDILYLDDDDAPDTEKTIKEPDDGDASDIEYMEEGADEEDGSHKDESYDNVDTYDDSYDEEYDDPDGDEEPEEYDDSDEDEEPEEYDDSDEDEEPEEYDDSDEDEEPEEYDDSDEDEEPEEYDDSDEDEELEEYDDSYDEESGDESEEEDMEYEDGPEEDDPITAEEKIAKHKKIKKVCAITFGSIVGVFLAVYFGLAVFFHSHYYFFTEINGKDFSGKTVANVEEYMRRQVEGYRLTMQEIDGTQEYINGSDISLEYQPGEELKKYMEKQNPFLWPQALWKQEKVETDIGVKYDEAALNGKLNALDCMKPENQTASVSAAPVFNGTEYEIQPETIGTQINTEVFNKLVTDAISQFKTEIDMKAGGCYNMPPFTKDSQEVIAAKDAMNNYLNASITYDLNPNTEVVDRTVISQWLGVDENMNVVFNTDAVAAYAADLASRYDTVGKTRTITTPSGKTAQVSGGSYGWEIDEPAETEALIANIQNGEQVTREPVYVQKAVLHGANDWGNTFVEVDLSSQYMWYIQDGNVVFEAAVVTGKPDPKHETPAGIFTILEKMRNKVLRGEKQPDGTYEYETPVSYWMRVTWTGIGFHDATWQSSFGGSRYRDGYGSHGCINMSYNGAATLYDMIYVGLPVIMHY